MGFKFKIFLVLILSIFIFALGIFFRQNIQRKYIEFDFETVLSKVLETLPSREEKFVADLENSLHVAFTQSNLNDKSFLLVNASLKDENSEIPIDKLKSNLDFQREFYIASLFKPLVVSAYINIMKVENLEYKIPFKFLKDDERKTEIANRIYEYLNYDTVTDSLIVNIFAPDFKDKNLSINQIRDELIHSEKYKNYEFTFKDLLAETLGPSSNWGILILREHMALNGFNDNKGAASALENYINEFLKENNLPENFRLFLSENSEKDKKYNSIKFYELEFLLDSIYKNTLEIPADVHAHMLKSMEEISSNPTRSNRRHEIKSMSKIFNFIPKIEEKSGYIGFDFNATPALDELNGWTQISQTSGKRIIIFNASSYSRIYLNSGNFIDLFYAIASPTQIGLDPYYEEFNDDYLTYKNRILDNIEVNVGGILQQYSDLIKSQ